MTIVDEQGRLFGRWNFFDALVVVLLLAIGPLGYAAFALFRAPDPELIAIEPAELIQGPNLRVKVRGKHLRPYLRLSFNTTQGATFLFQDTTRAEVDLHEMAPGVYDVVLYDFGQERHRLPKALTIKPNSSLQPTQDVVVVGRFIGLSQEDVALIKKDMPLPFPGEVLEFGTARGAIPRMYFGGLPTETPSPGKFEVPVVVRLSCFMKLTGGQPECGRADFTLRPNNVLTIPTSGTTAVSLQVDQIRGVEPVIEARARVRLFGPPEAVAAATRGDVEVEPRWNPYSLGSRIEAIDPPQAGKGERLATLIMRVQRMPGGLWNGIAFARVGVPVSFTTDRYQLSAQLLEIDE